MQSTVLRVTSHLPELEGRAYGPGADESAGAGVSVGDADEDADDDALATPFADDDADPAHGWGDDGW